MALGLVICALTAAEACAFTHRGHVFGFAFAGNGAGAFAKPAGVAVDEASGDVYVADGAHERVERFTPNGKGGYTFVSTFKVDSPGAVAVDNTAGSASEGDVYVVGSAEAGAEPAERDYMYKFTAVGEKIFRKSVFKAKVDREPVELELEDIQSVAVEPDGTVWVYWGEEGRLAGFDDSEVNGWVPSLTPAEFEGAESTIAECVARPDFAVAPGAEAFYVGYERESSGEECPGAEGGAPDPFLVAKLDGSGKTLVSKELDRANSTGVALDPASGDVYLDEGGSVAAFTGEGVLIQRFGSEQLQAGAGVALDSRSDEVFVADAATNQVDVFIPEASGPPLVDGVSARNLSPGSSMLEAEVDPRGAQTEYYFQYGTQDCRVSPAACTQIPVRAGELKAGFGDQSVSVQVQGLQPATAYYYRLLVKNPFGGPVEGLPSPNTFTTLPSPSVLPDGRAWELVSPTDKHGAAIESLPHEGGAMIMAAADGSAITWVANGALTGEPQGNRSPELDQLLSTRGTEGWQTENLETPHTSGRGIEKIEPLGVEYQDFSADLSLGLLQPAVPVALGETQLGLREAPPLSPEASEKTIYLRDDPSRTPSEAEGPTYERAGSEANRAYLSPGYLPLVSAANDSAHSSFGGALDFLGATPDLSHVVFGSSLSLTSLAPSAGGLYEWSAGGQLALVSVLPTGEPAHAPFLGDGEPANGQGEGLNARGAISNDGSRVFFSDGKEHLYLRDTVRGETIEVNAAQGHDATEPGPNRHEVPEPGERRQEVHYQAASRDGSRVFFTDTARLSEDATLESVGEVGPADLYEFELTSQPGEPLRGRLADLTATSIQGAGDVLNLLPGIGETGENVYFVANGVLAPGATPGHCARYPAEETAPPPAATCNLYLSTADPAHPGQRLTRFIAVLSEQDAADWGAGLSSGLIPEQDLSLVGSRVSPNGQYLAFMSERSLTGYDNEDTTSQHPGERLDEEVYLYDAAADRLICASCDPSGQRPTGVYDTLRSGEGLGPLVDHTGDWGEHWLAGSLPAWTLDYGREKSAVYQARYLSDSGRLFFNSPEPLVSQDTNSREDVYQYEPQNTGSCEQSGGCLGLISSGTSDRESAFLDASETGDDVFFLTAAQLVSQDADNAFDIYDARVCSESSPCLKPPLAVSPECETSTSCRPGTPTSAPSVATQPSESFTGPGNIIPHKITTGTKASPPSRAQQLTKALKACNKLRNRRKRVRCEAQARKRYAPRAKAKSKHRGATARRGDSSARVVKRGLQA